MPGDQCKESPDWLSGIRSRTSILQLQALLDQGAAKFGVAVAADKLRRLEDTIHNHLAWFPATKRPDRRLKLHLYLVTKTPFVLVYDFDDDELRIHFILHASADRRLVDPNDIKW
jgi:plasmid stabilization system protein ParE